jgi:hypothetical protein
MRSTHLGVGIASVVAATLFVPALAGASQSAPATATRVAPTVTSAVAPTAAAASAAKKRPKCAYPPHRAVLSIGPGNKTFKHPTSVTFGGRLHRGACGPVGASIRLINSATGDVVGRDTTDRRGGWGITVRVQRTNRYFARSNNPDARSGTVKITIRHHH